MLKGWCYAGSPFYKPARQCLATRDLHGYAESMLQFSHDYKTEEHPGFVSVQFFSPSPHIYCVCYYVYTSLYVVMHNVIYIYILNIDIMCIYSSIYIYICIILHIISLLHYITL